MAAQHRVPRRSTRTVLTAIVVAVMALAGPASVLAATVEELVALASNATYGMGCTQLAAEWQCTRPANNFTPAWEARIAPTTGQEDTLLTIAYTGTSPLEPRFTQPWMVDMHATACGDQPGVKQFIADVGDLAVKGSIDRDIGTCHFTGGFTGPITSGPAAYSILSTYVPPPPPTPTPTPKPTAKPTAKPTPTATPGPSPSPTLEPSPSPSLTPATTPTPTVEPSPTGIVAGVEASPSPAPTEPTGGGPTPAPSQPTFEQSVLGITDVSDDTGQIGGNLLLALLLLLIIGFAGELFNNTVENNYSIIAGWFKKGPLGWLRNLSGKFGEARIGLLLFLALTALVSSFVDPYFGFNLRSLAEFLGFLVGLIVVLASFKLPPMLAHRRKTGDLGTLRPLPWALVIAVLFVLVSRISNLQPGYLYGIVLGAIFTKDVSAKEEGRETFYGSVWTLAAAVLGWLGLTWLRGLGYDPAGFGFILLSTAFAAILVSGLEATAFGLMPLRFMPGHAVYKWNRLGWGLLFGLSIFGFVHILISPTSGYVSQLSPQAFIAACGVFAAFGALSIGTWLYFRLRRTPVEA